ncbi:MAG: glycosyltransferase [Phycisphaerae bacterium]|nr:glycosyltransferase [Phycisphaerae bacterium]
MQNGKFIIAKLWPRYGEGVPSRTPVILGINPQKYETICIYHTKNSDNPNVFEQNGKKVFYLTRQPSLGLLKFFAIFKLAALLKKQQVDILDCHHHKSVIYGAIAGKLAGVPIIIANVHGLGRTRNLKRKLTNFFIFRYISRILTVGQATKNDVLQNNLSVKSERIINIGNSIDCDHYGSAHFDKKAVRDKFCIPQNAFVFAAAGRLSRTKGQKFLIEAFSQVKKQIPNAELLIAGTGELEDELKKQASELGYEGSVRFPGRVENMTEIYSAIDVFVLPSIAEGLPRSMMEAMAAGVICVASNAGGIPEILDNGKFGFLVAPKDSNDLYRTMLKTADMPSDEKMKIISSAKKHIQDNYSHGVMIKRMEKIYDDLVSEKIE